jgi:hypothetical protein
MGPALAASRTAQPAQEIIDRYFERVDTQAAAQWALTGIEKSSKSR